MLLPPSHAYRIHDCLPCIRVHCSRMVCDEFSDHCHRDGTLNMTIMVMCVGTQVPARDDHHRRAAVHGARICSRPGARGCWRTRYECAGLLLDCMTDWVPFSSTAVVVAVTASSCCTWELWFSRQLPGAPTCYLPPACLVQGSAPSQVVALTLGGDRGRRSRCAAVQLMLCTSHAAHEHVMMRLCPLATVAHGLRVLACMGVPAGARQRLCDACT